jgi:hypothetical protein
MSLHIFIIMESKLCICCKKMKNIGEFHKNKSKKDGLQDNCKECRKLRANQNKEYLKKYKKIWYQKNIDEVIQRVNLRYSLKKDDINQKRREIYNGDELIRDKIRQQHKIYYKNNKELFYKKSKIWRENNKDVRNEISKRHYNKYKILMICRRLIKRTIKYLGTKKESTTIEMLGYSPSLFKEYIESKFTEGMTWDNYGEWHVDHIRPISSFNKTDNPKDVNALENLQPLWKFDNLSKGSKYNPD